MAPEEIAKMIERLTRAQIAVEESLAQFFVAQTKTEERIQFLADTVHRVTVASEDHEQRIRGLERRTQ